MSRISPIPAEIPKILSVISVLSPPTSISYKTPLSKKFSKTVGLLTTMKCCPVVPEMTPEMKIDTSYKKTGARKDSYDYQENP